MLGKLGLERGFEPTAISLCEAYGSSYVKIVVEVRNMEQD